MSAEAANKFDALAVRRAEQAVSGACVAGEIPESLDEGLIDDPVCRLIVRKCRLAAKDDTLRGPDGPQTPAGFDRNFSDNFAIILAGIGDTPANREALELCRQAARGRTEAELEAACTLLEEAGRRREAESQLESALAELRSGKPFSEIVDPWGKPFDVRRAGIVRVADLRRENPRLAEPVVDPLFRESEVASIIAATKMGKSWLVMMLCLCIASGRQFLGMQVYRGKVLLIDNELSRAVLWSRLRTVAEAMGLQPGDYEHNFQVWPQRGNWRDINAIADVLAYMRAERLRMVVIDALYRVFPKGFSEADQADYSQLMNTIDRTAQGIGAAVVLIHHASKGDQSGKNVTDVGSGAGAQSRAVDAHVVLRPHADDGCAVMEAALRSFPPLDPLALRFTFPLWSVATELDPRALRTPETANDRAQVNRDQDGMAAIRKSITSAGKALTQYELRKLTGFGDQRCTRLIRLLQDSGELQTTGESLTIRGQSAELFSLTI